MHRRQKLGLALGTVAAIICGGNVLLSIGYAGDAPILATWRDQPLVNLAGALAGASALYLVGFGANDGFFPWSRAPLDTPLSINDQVRAGIYLHALMTAFLLLITSLIVGLLDQPFSHELVILWIADGALWAVQGLYWLIFGSAEDAQPAQDGR